MGFKSKMILWFVAKYPGTAIDLGVGKILGRNPGWREFWWWFRTAVLKKRVPSRRGKKPGGNI